MLIPVHRSLRNVGPRNGTLWSPERRRHHLLDPECRLPISIDTRVTVEASAEDPTADLIELVATAHLTTATSTVWTKWGSFFEGTMKAAPESEGWLSIGFDVCDQAFYSALMNCALGEQQHARLGAYWSFALNQYHLFRRAADADSFREKANELVPEHAPFAVVQIFLVRPTQT
jgi:hypothetical protein